MIIVVSPSPDDAVHIRRALVLLDRYLRQQGRRLPGSLREEIVHVSAAPRGQDRSQRDVAAQPGDGESVTPLLISYAEAAERLGVGERTLRREVASGRLAVRRIGRRRLIDPDDLAAYVAGLAPDQDDPPPAAA